jgi:WHEP-TRS domain/OB-fold nucleic acid binding domain
MTLWISVVKGFLVPACSTRPGALALQVAGATVSRKLPRFTTASSSSSSTTTIRQKHLRTTRSSCPRRQQQLGLLLFSTSTNVDDLEQKIKIKGEEIRQLKADGVDKQALAPYVAELLALKAQLPSTTPTPETATTSQDNSINSPTSETQRNQPAKKQPKPGKEKKTSATSPVAKAATKSPEEMSEKELRYTRLAKVQAMREAGVEPYEYTYQPTLTAVQLASLYEGKLAPGEEDEAADVTVAGRIMTRRVFGKLAFFTLQDETGTIQLQFDKNRLGDAFQVRKLHEINEVMLVSVACRLHG